MIASSIGAWNSSSFVIGWCYDWRENPVVYLRVFSRVLYLGNLIEDNLETTTLFAEEVDELLRNIVENHSCNSVAWVNQVEPKSLAEVFLHASILVHKFAKENRCKLPQLCTSWPIYCLDNFRQAFCAKQFQYYTLSQFSFSLAREKHNKLQVLSASANTTL